MIELHLSAVSMWVHDQPSALHCTDMETEALRVAMTYSRPGPECRPPTSQTSQEE